MPIMDEREKVFRDDLTPLISAADTWDVVSDVVLVGPQMRECELRLFVPRRPGGKQFTLYLYESVTGTAPAAPPAGDWTLVADFAAKTVNYAGTRIWKFTPTKPYVCAYFENIGAGNWGAVSAGIVVGWKQKTA